MRSSRRTEVSLKSSAQQLTDHNIGPELTAAWKSLAQSKAALRHIENRLEATPGTGVLLESVIDPPKKKSSRTVHQRDGQHVDEKGGSSKRRGRSQQSPEKSSSRSPLRNTTQDSNVHRNNSVEFREPLTSYREATPPPHPSSQLEAYSLQSVPGSSHPSSPPSSDPLLSQLVYQRDSRDVQTDRDLDSIHSSALESTEVRYLNDQPALVNSRTIGNQSQLTSVEGFQEDRTQKAQLEMESQESFPCVAEAPGSILRGDSTPSSSPGSASQRLENLRRHQPDEKLEKLKERIRRQRQHLEEAAERERLLGYLEQPIMAAVGSNNHGTGNMPTAKVRKVTAAPPAPIYKGFNSTETKIRTPDGKVWNEEEFHNLSREIYRDLSRQFAETTRSRNQPQRDQRADGSKGRRSAKPVRKVHRNAPSFDLHAKAVISPASWRDGQKLVKMVLGPAPKPSREDRSQPVDGLNRTASRHGFSSDPCSEAKPRSRPNSSERTQSGYQGLPKTSSITTFVPSTADQDRALEAVGTDLLSADIQGILDDLQLECQAAEREERAERAERPRHRSQGVGAGRRHRGGSGSQTRTPVSVWGTNAPTGPSSRGCRSASPTSHRPHTANTADAGQKKRHYDADSVRQYILKQQEERKRRQAEEKRALREEADRRNQRLQELYRKQREVAKAVALPSEAMAAPVQRRLQETYNKLMEEVHLGEETTQTQPAAPFTQMRQMYQPSGESDKENKQLEAPQSPSSSDRSLNDQPAPPLSRNDLDVGVASLLQPDQWSPALLPVAASSTSALGDPLLSQLLGLKSAVAASDVQRSQRPATAPSSRSWSKMSRIEALKATAASLSNRIESEAKKLAGEGINYGAATSLEGDTVLAARPSTAHVGDGRWAEIAATENGDVALRFQGILTSTGHSSYNGTVLPGAGNLYAFGPFGGQKKAKDTCTGTTKTHTTSGECTGPIHNSYTHERRKLVNGFEHDRVDKTTLGRGFGLSEEKNQADFHDSSAGSISEGPLLSEGSFSEDEASPPRPHNSRETRRADHLAAVAGQRRDVHRLSEFQKEAVRYPALGLPFAQYEGSRLTWEELNKGSPLSVINIYAKQLHGHAKVNERNTERASPSAYSLHLGNGSVEAAVYEDDFVLSHSSGHSGQLKRGPSSHSAHTHFEELMRRSPYEKNTVGISSNHSSFHSSVHSPHPSSGSTSGSSPFSKQSSRKRGTASDQSDTTLVGEQRSPCSPPSDALSSDSRKRGSNKSSPHSQARSTHSNELLGETSQQSAGADTKKSPATRPKHTSPHSSPDSASPTEAKTPSEAVNSGSLVGNNPNRGTTAHSGRSETRTTGQLQYSPAVLQQRMAAELQYLESIEESVRHLGDVERLMGVSMAQQETVSLAQMLKAKQYSHERDLYELKIKAEREALEAQLQQEENRQRASRAHMELQESLAGTQKETLEGLQEATTKMMSQQAETARYTAETARHIKEMTEMARSQIAGALVVPSVARGSSILEEQKEQQSPSQQESDSLQSHLSSRRTGPEESLSPLNSLSHSDSPSFRRPNLSEADSSSHLSPFRGSSDKKERNKTEVMEGKQRKGAEGREAATSSIEEEVLAAANDSLCSDSIHSVVDEKGDSTSIATEYSLKFDESMTEDEIEERSFRSLLPSEAHRRGTKERSRHHEESEDDGANHRKTIMSGAHNILKDASMAFSGGQDSFSQFTMDMVRQYMKDEEVRLQHQSSLLHLRQKALKEKTRTELAWLELQKKQLRDKGKDDKMPPIRKKQRGLLLKLQQEQAEIKRLQEANKAARKERQLLLKQQEEIERMRSSTLRLKERLKCAGGETPPETPVSETPLSVAASANMGHAEDGRSPSPSLSISGSETNSIMQKLKKMRSHMEEKFLTKREQQLMQRRHHAEELLQWKQRLDQEEAEVRRIEKEAMAVWDRSTPKSQKEEVPDVSPSPSHHHHSELRTDSEKEYVSEGDGSSVTTESSIHTERHESRQPGIPSSVHPASVPETPSASIQSSAANYTQDFTSATHSPSRQSVQSPFKGSHSPASSPSDGSSKTRMQPRSSRTPNQARTQPADSFMAPQTEPISDQSDIESRIKALKEELRKRKVMAYQLKKEQKKRHKERLKAQEASLLKQLESYDNFIEKTKAELNKEADSATDVKSHTKDLASSSIADQSNAKASYRSETSRISEPERSQLNASSDNNHLPQRDVSGSTSVPEELSDEDPLTATPTPVHGSPEDLFLQSKSRHITEDFIRPSSKVAQTGNQEELEDQHSELPLEQEKADSIDSQKKLSKPTSSSISEERLYSSCLSRDQDNQIRRGETSEAEAVQSNIFISNKSQSSAMDHKSSTHLSPSSSSSHHSSSPDSEAFTSQMEAPTKDIQASSSVAEGYRDDFESSVDSSVKGEHQRSNSATQVPALSTVMKASMIDSQSEEVEEDIAEDLSHQSGTSVVSIQSGRQLELDTRKEVFKHDSEDKINSIHSPSVRDEMPSFNIGDRILVSGVQPGTLRFKGLTSFAHGFWAGVELDKSEGSNNGTYEGILYFKCNENHGIFAPPDKITHLPDKFEFYVDTTEDEDSFFDDLPDKGGDRHKAGKDKSLNLKNRKEEANFKLSGSGDKKVTEESDLKVGFNNIESELLIPNGNTGDIMLNFEDARTTLLVSDMDRSGLQNENQKEITTSVKKEDVDSACLFTPADLPTDSRRDKDEEKGRDSLDTCADKLLSIFVKDTVEQFTEIKKAKERKIQAANQMNGDLFGEHAEEEERFLSVEQKDGLPFFLPTEKEELSSPELCNRPESPVLGASGQEELAKRLAELELSRELLDELGNDQDWFDEDFGLSSRREQQRLKQKQIEEEEEEEEARLGRSGSPAAAAIGGLVSSTSGEQQVKIPPRPELPLPLPPKLPEQPAMVVPHSATEVEKMVYAATKEIWESYGLGKEGVPTLGLLRYPQPSPEYLGKEAGSQDQEAISIRSHRKAVYDLTWEMLQEIYAEDPNTDQPQWVKPCRLKSSFHHRVKTAGDISKVQEFITAEVLKLYGLTKDQHQKTDWQKMLKFGRKKRDRVDHILVQELHEEEAQWVNYDEDELFVKMQLADSIFDALLKDTANVLTLIYDKRAKVDSLS